MTFATVAFLVFAFAAIAAALMVILSRNPVHSVIFLITTFISVAGLFVLMGAEYLAMLLVDRLCRRGGGVIHVCGDDAGC